MNSKTRKQLRVYPPRQKKLQCLRAIRYYYLRLLRLEGNPKVIARGLACGVFAGCFPWFGFQTIIGVLLAFLLRGNKLAAALGTWVSNPLTYAPLFFFNFKIGQFVLGSYFISDEQFTLTDDWSKLLNLGTDILISLSVGSFIVGLAAAIATYFLTLSLVTRQKQKFQ